MFFIYISADLDMKTPHKSFTLIEILIVIVIIWLLAFTLIPRILAAQQRARDTGRIADVRQIGIGLQSYIYTNNTIPSSAGTGYKDISSISGVLLEHLKSIPNDKWRGLMVNSAWDCISSGNNYAYYIDGNKAAVTAAMEWGKGNTAFCKGQVSTKMMFPKHSDGYNLTVGDYTKAWINIFTNSESVSDLSPSVYAIVTGHADPLWWNNASLIERPGGFKWTTARWNLIQNFTVSESRPLTFSYFTKAWVWRLLSNFGIHNQNHPTNKSVWFCFIDFDKGTVRLYIWQGVCRIENYEDNRYRVSYTTTTWIVQWDKINTYYGDVGSLLTQSWSSSVFGLQLNEWDIALPYQQTLEDNHLWEMY